MKLIASQLDIMLDRARSLLDQLDFPSWDEFVTASSTAIHDLHKAIISSWNLAYISFRPIFILLGILSHYLAILLRIIAQHSIAHGWKAAKEGYYQLRVGTIWFIKFQRNLPSSAKYAELGALVVLITLWLLRRHVKKYRYAERINKWYLDKKRLALRKYHRFVERVAKTSSFLAILLPHLLYLVLVVVIKRVVPSVVTYFATRTYLCSIISFWHPLYTTFSVLGRLMPHLKEYKQEKAETYEGEENNKSTKSRKRGAMTPSRLKQQQQREVEMEGLRVEVVDLLKYWVVYAILLAIVRTGKLLPVIGQILNVTTVDNASTTPPKSGFFGRTPKSGLYSKLRLSGKFVEEVTFVFIIWLRLMPASITGDEVKENVTNVLSPKRPSVQTLGVPKGSKHVDKHRPVDIFYSKLSPVVLGAMNSSAFLTKRAIGDSRNEGSTFMSTVIQKLQSFLDLVVLVRLISKETKEWIIVTIVESSALLPAVTTLLMPSYFTKYGVVYVSLVVPAGYSISSCDEIQRSSSKLDSMMPQIDDASRYLQFWMIHAAVSILLASFAPLLAWIPLSTHATWILWAYIQLESSTRKIYGWFESELGKESLEETAVMRSTRRIIAALPSNVEPNGDANPNPDAEGARLNNEIHLGRLEGYQKM